MNGITTPNIHLVTALYDYDGETSLKSSESLKACQRVTYSRRSDDAEMMSVYRALQSSLASNNNDFET